MGENISLNFYIILLVKKSVYFILYEEICGPLNNSKKLDMKTILSIVLLQANSYNFTCLIFLDHKVEFIIVPNL